MAENLSHWNRLIMDIFDQKEANKIPAMTDDEETRKRPCRVEDLQFPDIKNVEELLSNEQALADVLEFIVDLINCYTAEISRGEAYKIFARDVIDLTKQYLSTIPTMVEADEVIFRMAHSVLDLCEKLENRIEELDAK